MAYHVVPVDDAVEHDTFTEGCVCGPESEFVEGGTLLVHHSLDGREHHEDGHDREACPLCSSTKG